MHLGPLPTTQPPDLATIYRTVTTLGTNSAGIDVRLVRYRDDGRAPAQWYLNADDRRAVLDSWLQLVVPFLSGYEPGAGT